MHRSFLLSMGKSIRLLWEEARINLFLYFYNAMQQLVGYLPMYTI